MNSFIKNETQVVNYEPGSLVSKILPHLLNIEDTDVFGSIIDDNPQVQYLDKYLHLIETNTLVIETRYIDRHFIDEFQKYHATRLYCNINSCFRIHAFRKKFDLDEFNSLQNCKDLENIRDFERFEDTDEFSPNYLGFIVIRPVPQALIGRTFLITLKPTSPEQPRSQRLLKSTFIKTVNCRGFQFKIRGLPFQKQDQRVGACATTALWSALSKSCNGDGMRAPTPSEVTEAATKSLLIDRPYPQSGLAIEQMVCAIQNLNFAPVLRVAQNPSTDKNQGFEIIKLIIASYLRSAIPVILGIEDANDRSRKHAITVCGLNVDNELPDDFVFNNKKYRSPFLQWKKMYFHDDRIGPYTRGEIYEENNRTYLSIPLDFLGRNNRNYLIQYILVPLYPKIRTSADDLLVLSSKILTLINRKFGVSLDKLSFDFCFRRSSKVLKDILLLDEINVDKVIFLNKIVLSRYAGIINIYEDNIILMRIILDTTDRIKWYDYDHSQISGIIINKTAANADHIAKLFQDLNILVGYR